MKKRSHCFIVLPCLLIAFTLFLTGITSTNALILQDSGERPSVADSYNGEGIIFKINQNLNMSRVNASINEDSCELRLCSGTGTSCYENVTIYQANGYANFTTDLNAAVINEYQLKLYGASGCNLFYAQPAYPVSLTYINYTTGVYAINTRTTAALYGIYAIYFEDLYSPAAQSIGFNTNSTTDGTTSYNETSKSIYVSIYVEGMTSTNTTIKLYNTTGIYQQYSGTGNFSHNFTELPVETYYFNATATNGTMTLNTTTRTASIYTFNTNITLPINNENVTRYLNISYTDTVTPTGTIGISEHNITVMNLNESLNFTIYNSTNLTSINYDLFTRNMSINNYSLKIDTRDAKGNKKTFNRPFIITRNADLNITAGYFTDNSTISNFTINITDQVTGIKETYTSTDNKTNINIIKDRNYLIEIDAAGYSIINLTTSFSNTRNEYRFVLYTENSVNIYLYDEITSILITSNISITFTQGLTEISTSTTTGNHYQDGLSEGEWIIKFSGGNYTLKTYTVTVGNRSTQTLNAYLSTSEQYTVFTIMDYDTAAILEGASVTMSKLINGSWTIINSKTSDITGRVQLVYTPSTKYQFIISLTGYDTNLFYLDPILFSTYNVRLTKTTSLTAETTPDLTTIDINYYNNLTGDTTWKSNSTNTLIWIITSPTGSIENYNLTLTYPGGSGSNNGILATGEQFSLPFNITNANSSSKVIIDYCYKSTTSSNKCFSFSYGIIGTYSNTSMISNKDKTYGMTVIERVLVVTIVTLMVAGMVFMIGGAMAGLLVSVMIMGFFMTIGFTTVWMNIPSLFIGIIILLKGGKE